eukprot:jgi/Ulvmu1/7836/UM004_0066.1
MPTEVEVKLRLPTKEAHDKLVEVLSDNVKKVYEQENFFFDGENAELSQKRCVMRLRFFNVDEMAVLTVKGKMTMSEGVGRAQEDEADVDVAQARTHFMENPSAMLDLEISPITAVKNACGEISGLKALGGFKNTRKVIDWNDHILEVDETSYDWGTVYEIECETSEPEVVREQLSAFLKEQGIEFKLNTTTKFSNFVNRSLD